MELLQVTASAEDLALSRHAYSSYCVIEFDFDHHIAQIASKRFGNSVGAVWPVQAQVSDIVNDVVRDGFVTHSASLTGTQRLHQVQISDALGRSGHYASRRMTTQRVFSGIQPTGLAHLGNFLGAIKNYVRMQDGHDAVYCIVDLHAVTVPQDPAELRASTLRMAQLLMAAGLDPERCILFVQSQVPQHSQLGWLMETTVSYGELSRMTQFKDKSDRNEFISSALFTYPALQAADILLYDTNFVPVGDDQRQHLELARDAAQRFNNRFGETFVVPEHVIPPVAARIMDLQRPNDKMSKSAEAENGVVMILEDLKSIEKKFKRAVTDSEEEVRFDRENKAGVSNLLEILSAVTDKDPEALAADYTQYGRLKVDTAEAVISVLQPIQERFAELASDPAETQRLLAIGADKAQEIASVVYERARNNMGFLGA